MYGQTRHRLQRLVRNARGGDMTPTAIAEELDAALDADWKLVQAAMNRVRGASAHTGNAAAMSVPAEGDEADL
jgi:hypothetical protein